MNGAKGILRRAGGPSCTFNGAVFSFLYFLKIKISKIYVCFEIFQKFPPSPPHRATGLKCNFFFKFAMRSLEKKGPVAPQRALGAYRPWAGRPPLGPAHGRGRAACRPPRVTGYHPYKSSSTPLPSSFEPENSTKNPEKKRGVRRRKAAKPCQIQHL